MSDRHEQLVAEFWKAARARMAEATDLWLAVEDGAADRLPTLRRLMHTIKGEAQMLGVDSVARLFELSENVVDHLEKRPEWPQSVGDALLGAFELLGVLATTEGAVQPEVLDEACRQLDEAERAVTSEEAREEASAPPPPAEARPSQEDEPQRREQVIEVEALSPLIAELRRLESERALLQPELRAVLRALHKLDREIKKAGARTGLSELNRRLGALLATETASEFAIGQVVEQIEDLAHRASVVSLARVRGQIHAVARGVARSLGKEVEVIVRGEAMLDAAVERRLTPALLHLVRNSVDHGLESADVRVARGKSPRGQIVVTFEQLEESVRVVVADDGGGIDFERVRDKLRSRGEDVSTMTDERVMAALFEHGLTTRDRANEFSGRGVGLDVVASEVALAGGRITTESTRGAGTRFVLVMPVTLRVDMAVPVSVGDLRCALPSRVVASVIRIGELEISSRGPLVRVSLDDVERAIPVYALAHLLGLPSRPPGAGDAAVVLSHPARAFAVTVDRYETPRPIAAQPQRDLAFDAPLVRAVAPTPDGNVLLVLDVFALHDVVTELGGRPGPSAPALSAEPRHVLVVEDAPVARELLCGMLRSFGLRVSPAADGREGLEIARRDRPDLVLTDIEMPVLGGLEMVARMRRIPELAAIPVLVLSSRIDDATRRRAADLRVRGFLAKQTFVEAELRQRIDECLRR